MRPLKSLIRPLKGLIRPFKSLIRPLKGLIRPLKGLIRPLKSLIRPCLRYLNSLYDFWPRAQASAPKAPMPGGVGRGRAPPTK